MTVVFRFISAALAILSVACAVGQVVQGGLSWPGAAGSKLVLKSTRGTQHVTIDSTVADDRGSFRFGQRTHARGFYQLAINDSDAVDIILDPAEREVELSFTGQPLQYNIRVVRSEENKRLWEYKLVSKEAQAIQASVFARKRELRPEETAKILALDSIAARAFRLKEEHLAAVIAQAPGSFFAKVVQADRGVEAAAQGNPQAVLDVFDFSDPELMRSSVYDKAVLTFLRNIHASSEDQFIAASDSLLHYASSDPDCRAYMLDHLIELFSTYGPDLALQHLIDTQVRSEDGLRNVDPRLHAKVREILRMGVGRTAPDILLPTPRGGGRLSELVAGHRATALFFYSSTCDHCHQEMGPLKEVRAAFADRGFEVIGIALDADSAEFKACISERGLPWPCYSEFKGWGAEAVKSFQVRATPWFYLLDDRLRILAKPHDALALGAWLQEHLR